MALGVVRAVAGAVRLGFPGIVSGYSSGGWNDVSGVRGVNSIVKYSFTSDGNATDVGDLIVGRYGVAGQSSFEHGYSTGGGFEPPFAYKNEIDRFPFASDTNATDVGDLANVVYWNAGQSDLVGSNGYSTGGNGSAGDQGQTIEKFPFAATTNATDIGNLRITQNFDPIGQSSSIAGYVTGGNPAAVAPTSYSTIEKFPFASDTTSTSVGTLAVRTYWQSGQSSADNGYTTGGTGVDPAAPGVQNVIQRFPFASDNNATDVGDLTFARSGVQGSAGGTSSESFGYMAGGKINPSDTNINIIDKFSFADESTATDVGDLVDPSASVASQQA